MRERLSTPIVVDWSALIADLVATGMPLATIGKRMGCALTTRMLRFYASGSQPVHFRGELLVELWCERLAKDRAALPKVEIVRGHRAVRPKTVDTSPKLQALPDWPRSGQ